MVLRVVCEPVAKVTVLVPTLVSQWKPVLKLPSSALSSSCSVDEQVTWDVTVTLVLGLMLTVTVGAVFATTAVSTSVVTPP